MSAIKLLFYGLVFCALLIFSSCLGEPEYLCPEERKISIKINALDASNNDISSTGLAGDARLYIFDNNQQYLDQLYISSDDIKNKTPININYPNTGNLWLIVWSNLSGKENVTKPTKGMTVEQSLIQLKRNAEGHAVNPDDLFWGIKQVSLKSNKADSNYVELDIKRKTALVNIIVKGLKTIFKDYFFVIDGSKEDAYSFDGKLKGIPVSYKQTGAFDASNTFFSTSVPFTMYPLSDGNYNSISIYRGTSLVVSTHINSVDGKNIVPIVGVTNNILINLSESTTANVNIKITDWDEIYSWVEW